MMDVFPASHDCDIFFSRAAPINTFPSPEEKEVKLNNPGDEESITVGHINFPKSETYKLKRTTTPCQTTKHPKGKNTSLILFPSTKSKKN